MEITESKGNIDFAIVEHLHQPTQKVLCVIESKKHSEPNDCWQLFASMVIASSENNGEIPTYGILTDLFKWTFFRLQKVRSTSTNSSIYFHSSPVIELLNPQFQFPTCYDLRHFLSYFSLIFNWSKDPFHERTPKIEFEFIQQRVVIEVEKEKEMGRN